MVEQTQVISTLKQEAKTNQAANAVFHVWAMRERARGEVTLRSLALRMRKEGFSFSQDQYAKLLTRLADLELGDLQRSPKGKVTGLRHIKLTLQSIGAAAVGQQAKLEKFRKRAQYGSLATMAADIKGTAEKPKLEFPVSLTVVINGKPVNFRVPNNLSTEEIAQLVKRFHDGVSQ